MSKTVDERVVSMQFDNRNFEQNVKTSMSTLDRLKQALKFDKAGKGLDDLNTAVKKVSFNPLSAGVDAVSTKFSALQVAAVTVLSDIVRNAEQSAKSLVNAFTFDPITSGFQEYETQMNAVQTIMANTSSKGTTLDQVNSALDELNHYADKTIYNFTEMTRNIGTFTAAGVDLDTSVSAIQGIANLAAISGSTSAQASTAMYQLSQAIAAGQVNLQDWNSVVNAGMGGQVFQDALKETGRLMGANIDESQSFRESISAQDGTGWLTAEILLETLKKFTTSGANEYVAEYCGIEKEAVEAALESAKAKYGEADAVSYAAQALADKTGKNKDEIESVLKMAQTAEDAATKVKTFSQLMDTLKEAAQSGWTESWQTILGDFEQAKTLFTEASDYFGGMIQKSADARNSLLHGALDSKWDTFIEKVNEAGISTEAFETQLTDMARRHAISIDDLIKEHGSLTAVIEKGLIPSNVFADTLNEFTVNSTEAAGALADAQQYIVQTGDTLSSIAEKYSMSWQDLYALNKDIINDPNLIYTDQVLKLSDAQLENIGYTKEQISVIKDLAKRSVETGKPINELVEAMGKPSGRELLIDSFRNAIQGLVTVISTVKKAWRNLFPATTSDQLYKAIEAFHNFTEKLKMNQPTAKNLQTTLEGLFSILHIIVKVVGTAASMAFKVLSTIIGSTSGAVLKFTTQLGHHIKQVHDWIMENDLIVKVLKLLGRIIVGVIGKVKEFTQEFQVIPKLQNGFSKLKTVVSGFVDGIAKTFPSTTLRVKAIIDRFKDLDSITFDDIINFAKLLVKSIKEDFSKLDIHFEGIQKVIESFKKRFGELVEDIKGMDKITLSGILKAFKDFFSGIFGDFGKIDFKFDGFTKVIETFKKNVSEKLGAAGVSFGTFFETVKTVIGNIVSWIQKHFNLGSILVAALGSGYVFFIVKIAKFVGSLTKLADGIGGFFDGIKDIGEKFGGVLTSTSKVLNAFALKVKSQALINIALAIAILVGSIALIALVIPKEKLLASLGVLAALAVGLVAFATAMNFVSKISKDGAGTKAILAIASSALMLVVALKIMEGLDQNTIGKNALVLAGIVVTLVTMSSILAKYAPKLSEGAWTLVAISASVFILVYALKKIGDMDSVQILNGISGLLAITAMLIVLLISCSLCGAAAQGAGKNILAISAALLLMVGVIGILALVPLSLIADQFLKLIAIASIFAVFSLISRLAGSNAKGAGSMLLKISAAMLILVGVIAILGLINPATVWKGIAAVAAIMIFFSAVIAVSYFAGEHASKAGTMLLKMSIALLILGGVIAILSMLNPDGLQNATTAITDLMLCFALLIGVTHFARSTDKMIKVLRAFSVSLAVLGIAIGLLSMCDQDKILTASLALGNLMVIFGLIIAFSGKCTGAAKTILAMSAVIAVLGIALFAVGQLPVEKSLFAAVALSAVMLAFAGAMQIIAGMKDISTTSMVAMVLMTGVVVALALVMNYISGMPLENTLVNAIALSAVLMAMMAALNLVNDKGVIEKGAALVLAAGSFWIAAQSLAKLATLDTASMLIAAGALSLVMLILAGISKLANVGGAMALLFMSAAVFALVSSLVFLSSIGVDSIIATVLGLAAALLILSGTTAILGGAAFPLFLNGCVVLLAFAAAVALLGGALQILATGIERIVEVMGPFIQNILDWGSGVVEGFKSFVQKVKDFLGIHSPSTVFNDIGTNIIKGLKGGISGLAEGAVELLLQLGADLVQAIKDKIEEFKQNGKDLIENLKQGIADKIQGVKDKIHEGIQNGIQAIKDKLEEFKQKGKDLIEKLKQGIHSKIQEIKNKVGEVVSGAVQKVKDKIEEFKTAGKDAMQGFANGIGDKVRAVKEAAENVGKKALKGLKDLLGIASPSKEFAKLGRFSDLGMAKGLSDFSGKVSSAAKSVGTTAFNSMSGAVSKIGKAVNLDASPVIAPVVDMSNAKATDVQLSADITRALSRPIASATQRMYEAQAAIDASNKIVADSINGLRDEMNAYYSQEEKETSLYIDGKKLASSIAKPMNRQLNILAKRRAY